MVAEHTGVLSPKGNKRKKKRLGGTVALTFDGKIFLNRNTTYIVVLFQFVYKCINLCFQLKQLYLLVCM